jgi:hypothetical protein
VLRYPTQAKAAMDGAPSFSRMWNKGFGGTLERNL